MYRTDVVGLQAATQALQNSAFMSTSFIFAVGG